MAFKTIEKKALGAVKSGVAISAYRHSAKSGLITKVRFGPDILDAMNWSPGMCLGVGLGDGHDTGKLRIGLDEIQGFKIYIGNCNDRSKFIYIARIGDGEKHPSQAVTHKIANGYLFIDLPDWALPKSALPVPTAPEPKPKLAVPETPKPEPPKDDLDIPEYLRRTPKPAAAE